MLAVNLLGDGLRDALDPRLAKRLCDGDAQRQSAALLEVENLQTHFATPDGVVRAVEGLSFQINAGETVAIVGESGCGKSVTSMSILRLIAEPPGKIAGSIRFEGRDLLDAVRAGDARDPRQRDLDDLPGADDQPESGADGRASRSARRCGCIRA